MSLLLLPLLQAGPMIPDLSADVVTERIEFFQARLETLLIKYERQASSERLFGLPVTEYPELHQIGHELNLLQQLYDLYNDVMRTIHGYFDIRWHDVDIESISSELSEFQTRCCATYIHIFILLYDIQNDRNKHKLNKCFMAGLSCPCMFYIKINRYAYTISGKHAAQGL